MSTRASLNALTAVAALVLAAAPPSKTPRSPIAIRNGVSKVDFAGDGSHGLIVEGHRENGNAHSFEVVSFYVLETGRWNIVPIDLGEQEKEQVRISGGADCLLHDFRLLQGSKSEPSTLILADRELGESLTDVQEVTFTYYSLMKDRDGTLPAYYFEKSRSVKAAERYCDVEQAFKEELQY